MTWQFLCGNDAFSILVLSTIKRYYKTALQFFEKGFRFPEKLFQSSSIENVQNFPWLSHRNMAISQTECASLKIPTTIFRSTCALSVGFKMKPLKKKYFSV